MSAGRPPLGDRHLDDLEGGEEEKRRLRVILGTLSGEMTIDEASEELALSERRIHQIREVALRGALDALTPRPPGRHVEEPDERSREIEELRSEVRSLKGDLEVERIRRELTEDLEALDEVAKKKEDPPPRNRAERRRMRRQTRRK